MFWIYYCKEILFLELIGKYETALQILIYVLKNEESKKYVLNNKFISNILDNFNVIILSDDSIFQVRKIEVLLYYIDYTFPNQFEKSSNELKKYVVNFIILIC